MGCFKNDSGIDFSHVYAANSAIGLQWKGLSQFKNVTSIVNSCGHGRFNFSCLSGFPRIYFSALSKAYPKNCVIIGDESHAQSAVYAPNTNPKNVDRLSARMFRRQIMRPLNISSFVISNEIVLKIRRQSTMSQLNFLRKIVMSIIKMYLNRNRWPLAHFRPSTGILTLLYAIKMHGADADYYISNIGISERNDYAGLYTNGTEPEIPTHVHADIKVIAKLTSRYRIYCNDEGLCEQVPCLLPY